MESPGGSNDELRHIKRPSSSTPPFPPLALESQYFMPQDPVVDSSKSSTATGDGDTDVGQDCSSDDVDLAISWSEDENWEDAETDNTIFGSTATRAGIFRFSDLPTETRLRILSFCVALPLGETHYLDQSITQWSLSTSSPGIMRISRELYDECMRIFLQENDFLFGAMIANPMAIRNLGGMGCSHLRSLSIQLSGRRHNDCVRILNFVDAHCLGLQQLDLRVTPGMSILGLLVPILPARAALGPASRTNVTFRFHIRATNRPIDLYEQLLNFGITAVVGLSLAGFPFMWSGLLYRLHEITIKGIVYRSTFNILSQYTNGNWAMEQTHNVSTPDCATREGTVEMKWHN